MNEVLLSFCVFLTSSLTATLGVGGGMLLIGIMPWFLPINSVVPLHAVVQFSSNISRALLNIYDIVWVLLKQYTWGALLGIAAFGLIFIYFPLQWLSPLIGVYILISLWWKRFATVMKKLDAIWLVGFLQTGLGLFVGATGPLSTSALVRRLEDKNAIIASAAAFATLGCLLRLVFFMNTGFDFLSHLPLIVMVSIAAILGSYIGTLLRKYISNDRFVWVLKILLTIIALTMIFPFEALLNK